MGQLAAFIDLAEDHKDADFVTVYLEEAHPTEGWLYPSVEHFIKQHKILSDRLSAASILHTKLQALVKGRDVEVPLLVDSMQNSASRAFGALPERLVIIHEERVHFIGGRGPQDYSISEVSNSLRELTG
jgi:hypothetical protein